MPNLRRQRSLWARIKLSEKIEKICIKALVIYLISNLIKIDPSNSLELLWPRLAIQLLKSTLLSAFAYLKESFEFHEGQKKDVPTKCRDVKYWRPIVDSD